MEMLVSGPRPQWGRARRQAECRNAHSEVQALTEPMYYVPTLLILMMFYSNE